MVIVRRVINTVFKLPLNNSINIILYIVKTINMYFKQTIQI